jgi:hypothetical protein
VVPKALISEDTIEALAGDAAENVTQVTPLNMLAVSVTPSSKLNDPPAVAPPVVSFRT